jgi:hypothetical protein
MRSYERGPAGEVHGHDKQGAGFGYTHKRGYHPILATRAGSGEVLHSRVYRRQLQKTARTAGPRVKMIDVMVVERKVP